MAKTIKVLIADDHILVREGLANLLSNEPDLEVIAMAKDGEEAVSLVKELNPDVAIIDVAMPGIGGIKAVEEIKASSSETRILMLSAYGYEAYLFSALRAGSSGYLLKTCPMDEVITAIRSLYKRQAVFDVNAINILLKRLNKYNVKKVEDVNYLLHPRQIEVLRLAANGNSNRQIAKALNISERTVQTHLIRIFRTLGVKTRMDAVLYALKEGILNLEDLFETKQIEG